MRQLDCVERIRLVDGYGRYGSEYTRLQEALSAASAAQRPEALRATETALADLQQAWALLAEHLAQHRCVAFVSRESTAGVMESAAENALDVILVVNDERRFVEVNSAAEDALGLRREQIVGQRIDDFFIEARGESISDSWAEFVAEGVQCGICEITATTRRFEYRAKSNFVPGLHLSVLRELDPTPKP